MKFFSSFLKDKKFSEILTGSAWAVSAHIVSAGINMILSIFIARRYGANVIGIVAVITSYLSLVTIFTVLGTDTSILRLVPEYITKHSPTSGYKIYKKIQLFIVCVSIVSGSVLLIFSKLIAEKIFLKPHLAHYFAIASVFVIARSFMLINTSAVRSLKLVRFFGLMQILPSFSNLVLLLILSELFTTNGVPVVSYLCSLLITALVGWIFVEFAFKLKKNISDTIKIIPLNEIFRISFPMLMTTTMYFLITQTGVILLGIFRHETEVGFYSVSVKLSTLTIFILQAINTIAAPKFSELYHAGKMDELFYIARKSTKLIFFLTTPILLILLVFGKFILALLFGKEFVIAYLSMVLLLIGQFINAISGSIGFFMNMTGNEKTLRNIVLITAMLNIVVNLCLIPLFGFNGAAFAAMISMAFLNIVSLLSIKKKFGLSIGYLPGIR